MNQTIRMALAVILLSLFSCSKSDSSPSPDPQPDPEGLSLDDLTQSVDDNEVIQATEITFTLPQGTDNAEIRIYLDDALIGTLSEAPYVLDFDPTAYPDGTHSFRIVLYQDGQQVGSRSFSVRIDNLGPTVSLQGLDMETALCTSVTVQSTVSDAVSGIASVTALLDGVLLWESSAAAGEISIDPSSLSSGTHVLSFEMEDELGNQSQASFEFQTGLQAVEIIIPDDFIRTNVDVMHIILSDADGNVLDYATHNSGNSETLAFCAAGLEDPETRFILTFVSDFQSSVFGFTSYQDLTRDMFSEPIRLPERTGGLNPATVDIDFLDFQDGQYIRARPPWGSLQYYPTLGYIQGHASRTFSNPSLGTNKTLLMNYFPDVADSYSYALLEDIYNYQALTPADFTTEGVLYNNLEVIGSFQSPFVAVYGYESEAQLNALNGHELFWNPSLNPINNFDYAYPDIFYETIYKINVSNYSTDGIGAPPASVTVPQEQIAFSFSNGVLTFQGLTGYQTNRMRLRNIDGPHVTLYLVFDGQAQQAIVPQLPEGIFPDEVMALFATHQWELLQGSAEKYQGYGSYADYIYNSLVTPELFYLTSPRRERIWRSGVGGSFLPMEEFPHYQYY